MLDQNSDWKIENGLLTHNEPDYWIDSVSLARADHRAGYDMLHHVLGKAWVNPESFVPAFRQALEQAGKFNAARWETTMHQVRAVAYTSLCWAEAKRRLGTTGSNHQGRLDMNELAKIESLANKLAGFGWDGRVVATD